MFFGFLLALGAEIAAFVLVAGQIGFLWALALLLVVSALGPFVIRRVGVGVLMTAQGRIAQGELPTRELLDGVVVLLAGVLICVPGFVGDALGLVLMIGPIRHFVIRTSGHHLTRRVQKMRTGRWQVVNVQNRPVPQDVSPSLGVSVPALDPAPPPQPHTRPDLHGTR